jgi:hypothetical protein
MSLHKITLEIETTIEEGRAGNYLATRLISMEYDGDQERDREVLSIAENAADMIIDVKRVKAREESNQE